MKIPYELETKIEHEIENVKLNELREVAQKLSDRYINKKRVGFFPTLLMLISIKYLYI